MGKTKKRARTPRDKIGASKVNRAISKAKAISQETAAARKLASSSSSQPPHSTKPSSATIIDDVKGNCSSASEIDDYVQPRQRTLSAHQKNLQRKLESANFRMLNETLYTTPSARAFTLMSSDPGLFRTYHSGYAQQTRRWPCNPLDDVVTFLHGEPDDVVVADFGCGEARLAREIRQRVHSFDLIAETPEVVACDMSKVPLPASSVDVAVFCLSLMGTNYGDFLAEARRVLTVDGIMLVAEVASRFDGHDPQEFVRGVERLGFEYVPEHPFTTKEDTTEGSEVVMACSKTVTKASAKGRKKRGGAKHKKKVVAASCASNGREGDLETKRASAFFYKMAFRNDKETRDGRVRADLSFLPKLAPCVYKRR